MTIKNQQFDANAYDTVITSNQNILIGGFSMSFSNVDDQDSDGGTANNCLGGNCTANCGAFQNLGCNKYAGCG